MTLLSLAAAAAVALAGGGDDALPRSLAAQEQAPPKPDTAPPEQDSGAPDLGPIQVQPHLGILFFSEDFEADPELVVGVGARASLPSLSRDVLGLEDDAVGLFLDLSFSSIDRDVPFVDDTKGNLFFVTLGADFRLYDDETWTAHVQLAGQYGHFGNVDDTESGLATVLGLSGGIKIAPQFEIVVNPQIAFGNGGDQIYFLNIGLQIEF